MMGRTAAARSAEAAAALMATMRDLGYSAESTSLYIRLMVQGPRTPAQVRESTGLADAGLHGAVRALLKDGLVFEDRDGGGTSWYCRDPATAWLSLAAAVTWSVAPTLRPLHELPHTGRPEIDGRKALYLRALRPALALWKPRDDDMRRKHIRAPNSRILTQLALEAIDLAGAHVRGVSVSPKIAGAAPFWPVLQRKLKQGVAYTRLADVTEVYEHGLDIVRRDLADGIDLRLSTRAELVTTRGYLSDRRILVKYDSAPVGQRPESGVMTSDPHAIDRFVRRFNKVKATAVPAPVVLEHLGGLAVGLRQRAAALDPDAAAWLDALIRMGRYAQLPEQFEWSARRTERAAGQLAEAGLARVGDDGMRLPAWPDADGLLLALRASAQPASPEPAVPEPADAGGGDALERAAAAAPDW
jgi:hypothetical protein